MSLSAEQIVRNAEQLPPPPKVMTDLLALFARPEVDARSIADTIASDLTLSLRTLKVANSPFYGLSKRISTVHDAIAILGFRALRMLALAVGSAQLMHLPPALRASMGHLLRHSTRCAMLARLLAEKAGAAGEEAFTAGILHDVGKIVLAQTEPVQTPEHGTTSDWILHSDTIAERAAFGTDHAEAGQILLRHWKFPEALCEAAGRHHQPPDSLPPLCALIGLADQLADIPLDGTEDFPPPALAPWIARAMGDTPLPDTAALAAVIAEADALANVLEADA
ncbi:MAG: HDOD domain-containing protein [Denitromonas halophila]|nr:MAG: HDOD domain-containing protein [Denitromonas halophila]TVT74505.1 MAG: HDOD domain-containing protein [Denitromonas halophila]